MAANFNILIELAIFNCFILNFILYYYKNNPRLVTTICDQGWASTNQKM